MSEDPVKISVPTVEVPKLVGWIYTFFTHRGSLWLWISLGLLAVIFFTARHMISVALWKIALLTIAAYLGNVFANMAEGVYRFGTKSKRPHEYQAEADRLRAAGEFERAFQQDQLAHAMLWRRAIYTAGAMIAAAMGG